MPRCHSDDIEIGCGGTILRLAEEHPECAFHWVVFNAEGGRETEARRGAELFAAPALKPIFKSFRDGFMPFVGDGCQGDFRGAEATVSPDLIFTHNRKDAHQDHRLIAELTWNTFRNHFILEYEIPKYDGDLGQPSVFVPLEEDIYREKGWQSSMDSFKSQRLKRWFQPETFLSLMRLRGMECNLIERLCRGILLSEAGALGPAN